MVLIVPAKKVSTDVVVSMVAFGIAPEAGVPGAYGVNTLGQAIINRSSSVSADGAALSITVVIANTLGYEIRCSDVRISSGCLPLYKIAIDAAANIGQP